MAAVGIRRTSMPDMDRTGSILGAVALALVATLVILTTPGTAHAEAVVVVKVRTPAGKAAEGRVTLVPRGDGERHSCTTKGGTCRMEGVPGGSYEVRLDPAEGQAPSPRRVMIPPSGEATLIVSTSE
jgi:hypothetical protein